MPSQGIASLRGSAAVFQWLTAQRQKLSSSPSSSSGGHCRITRLDGKGLGDRCRHTGRLILTLLQRASRQLHRIFRAL